MNTTDNPCALNARMGLARFNFVKGIKFLFCVSHDTVENRPYQRPGSIPTFSVFPSRKSNGIRKCPQVLRNSWLLKVWISPRAKAGS